MQNIDYPFFKTDAGRSHSKRPKQKNDCTVRALALATYIPYDQAYDILAEAGRKCSKGFHFENWIGNVVVNRCRFTWAAYRAVKGKKRMHIAQFLKEHPKGVYIIRTAKHVSVVIDGVLHDEYQERPDRCIYGSWERKLV